MSGCVIDIKKQLFYLLFCLFGSVSASSEVSLDLSGYVDSQVNIERIDDNGTLNIFDRTESRFRVTSNLENVKVTFKAQNEWKLLHEDDPKGFITYEGLFKGNNKSQIVNNDSDSVTLNQKSDFAEGECEFGVIFRATEKIKEKKALLTAGRYYGRVTISVSSGS